MDEHTYRRLEELGFRRRTPRNNGQCYYRMRPRVSPPIRRSQCCISDAQTSTEPIPVLNIKNVSDATLPEANPLSFNSNRFSPTGSRTGDSSSKRSVNNKRTQLKLVFVLPIKSNTFFSWKIRTSVIVSSNVIVYILIFRQRCSKPCVMHK